MIVPQYWSESKLKKIVNGKQFTLKRFGWSDISELEAQKHADERLKEAEDILDNTGHVRRIDHKVSYNGAEGIPIREEIISRHQDNIITRNSYGALCINTPNVLFADIDFDSKPSSQIYLSIISIALIFNIALSVHFSSLGVFFTGLVLMLFFTSILAYIIDGIKTQLKHGPEAVALQTIKQVSENNPDLHLRVYRTPMGLRVLAMNDTFNPRDDASIELLNSLNTDHLYTLMCKNQNCFRARITPKPWRMGMDRLAPNPGIWPIKQQHLEHRAKWVSAYDNKSQNYSSCHFITQIGSDTVVPEAEEVRKLHDEYCKVDMKNLELA